MNQDQAKKILNTFNDLASSILRKEKYNGSLRQTYSIPVSSSLRGESEILLQGRDSHNRIEEFIEQFWDVDREIRQTVSAKTIREKVIDLIFLYQKDKSSITTDSFKRLRDELLRLPKQNWLVLRPVYGASLGSDKPSQLGPFTLYTWDAYQSLVASKDASILDSCLQGAHECKELDKSYPSSFPMLENLGNVFISVQVSVRDSHRALDLADERFSQFENVISYMLGLEAKSFDFGVINSSGLNVLESLLICSENVSYSNASQDNIFPLQLDSPFFLDGKINFNEADHIQYWENLGHAWIWEALKLKTDQLTEWHKRILSSVEWIGKGIRDKNSVRSLVQFAFSLETLLTYERRNITKNLAELTALILKDDSLTNIDGQCINLKKKVKKIYDVRSGIVHGGKQTVSASIVSDTLKLMKYLITRIITNPELIKLKSIEQVKEWANKKKYS